MPAYILVFFVSALLSLLLTRLQIGIAHRFGWLDFPSPRRIHSDPTPRLGGIAMYVAFSSVLAGLVLTGRLTAYPAAGLLVGCTVLALVGFADDVWGLPASTKFAYQLLAAVVAVAGFELAIRSVTLPSAGTLILEDSLLGYGLSVFWLLGMINTVNFADGIDGLAGGLAVVFALVLLLVSLNIGQAELPLYAAALGGVALGFLRYNFAPARIFMGDSGSMFLGFTMGVLSVAGSAKLATGLLVMGLPVVDVAYSIVRRVRSGARFHMPDKEHLHHRFLSLGLSQRRTALLFYALALGFGSAGLIPRREGRVAALIALGVVSVALIWWVNRRLSGTGEIGRRGGC